MCIHHDLFNCPPFLMLTIGAGLILLLVRMFPTVIAFCRRHPQRWSIFGLNLFVGAHSFSWTALMARAWEVI